MHSVDEVRRRLRELGDTIPFPQVVEPMAGYLRGVRLLVAAEESDEERTVFTVGRDSQGRNWIYAYLDEDALRKGCKPGQQYVTVDFDDLVEIAKHNGFGGITIDQDSGDSTALLPEDYFDAMLIALGRQQ